VFGYVAVNPLCIKLPNKDIEVGSCLWAVPGSGGIMAKEKIRVRLRGFDVELIDQSARSIVQAVQRQGTKVSGPIPLPTRINKYTVLRSPFVNKKSREQFEMRTHKRLIDVLEPTSAVMDALMKLELPAGVDVEIKQ